MYMYVCVCVYIYIYIYIYMYVCSITHAYNVGSRLFIRMWQLISLDLLKMVFVFIGVASVRLHIQRFSPLQLTLLYVLFTLYYYTILYYAAGLGLDVAI